ncbi:MAG: hypothetical protein PHF67_05015 [Candidatus Nanoarchaeia archaeon]|nr:hypothetical protein [Candidatus Nanoarchaeia archaeon]
MRYRIEINQDDVRTSFSVCKKFSSVGEDIWRQEGCSSHYLVRNPIGDPVIWPVIREDRDEFYKLNSFEVVDYSSVSSEDAETKAYAFAREHAKTIARKRRVRIRDIVDNTKFAKSKLDIKVHTK